MEVSKIFFLLATKRTWWEYGFTSVNMVASVYMANTINTDWNDMSPTFNVAMIIMLLCVFAMYGVQAVKKTQDPGAAKNSMVILSVDCILYLAALMASLIGKSHAVLAIDTAAVLVGAFLPFFIRGNFDISVISFPHLAERFELITIMRKR